MSATPQQTLQERAACLDTCAILAATIASRLDEVTDGTDVDLNSLSARAAGLAAGLRLHAAEVAKSIERTG